MQYKRTTPAFRKEYIGVEGIEYMPHELVFGRSAKVPINSILADDKSIESYPEYTTALF